MKVNNLVQSFLCSLCRFNIQFNSILYVFVVHVTYWIEPSGDVLGRIKGGPCGTVHQQHRRSFVQRSSYC